jgi:hypothetical protein
MRFHGDLAEKLMQKVAQYMWVSCKRAFILLIHGDVVGLNIENGSDMCFFASIDGDSGSNCVPATKASSWAAATQGDGGGCPTPSWLSN